MEKSIDGRPTLYRKEYDEQAYKLTLLGAIDKDLADFFGVTEQTINNWKKDKDGNPTSFFESLKRGKMIADAEVAKSLYERATGVKVTETRTEETPTGLKTTTVTKELPPDPASMFGWLRNRRPDLWRANPEPEDSQEPVTPVKIVVDVQDGRKHDTTEPEYTASEVPSTREEV